MFQIIYVEFKKTNFFFLSCKNVTFQFCDDPVKTNFKTTK